MKVTRPVPPWIDLFVRLTRRRILPPRLLNLARFHVEKRVRGRAYVARMVVDGTEMVLHLDDHVDFWLWLEGVYEPEATAAFRSILRDGDRVLDVGANIGYYCVLAANRVGNSGRVIAFEPVTATFQRLQLNVRRFAWIEPVLAACGDVAGTADIHVGGAGATGSSRLLAPLTCTDQYLQRVDVVRLDDFLQDRGVTTVHVAKIDVEGYEMHVLRGMTETLRRNPELVLLLEVKAKFIKMGGSTPEEFFDFLAAFGFRPWECVLRSSARLDFVEHKGYWGDQSIVIFARNHPLARYRTPVAPS